MNIYSNIIKPVLTEKSSAQQEMGKYTFIVPRARTTKIDIKAAFEKIYGVKVDSVKIIISPKKIRQAGKKIITKRPLLKKAIVTTMDKKPVDINKIKLTKKK